MTMLNARGTLWCILGMLFVFSITAAFAQQEQQSDSALSQSQADKIIEKIDELEKNMLKGMHELELKMRDHVDTKFKELDNKFNKLDKEVAVLRSDVNNLFWVLTVIGVPAFLYFLNLLWSKFKLWLNKDKEVSKVSLENRNESDENFIQDKLKSNRTSGPEFT